MRSFYRLAVSAWLFAGVLVVCSGCSEETGPKKQSVVPVKGTLVYKDRKKGAVVPEGAEVIFNPVKQGDEKNPVYPQGKVQKDGSYRISTYGDFDGAPEGDYAVVVVYKTGGLARDSERTGGTDALKGRYSDPRSTKLKATVKGGSPNEFAFEVE